MTHRVYELAEARHERLARLDAKITRCPHCGAWCWLGNCTLTHPAHKESA